MSVASSSIRSVIISKALRRISPRWRGLGLTSRVECREGVLRLRIGDLTQGLPGRGILHGKRAAPRGVAPLTVYVKLLLDTLNDGLLGRLRGHVAILSF